MGHEELDVAVAVVPRAEAEESRDNLNAARQSVAVWLLFGGDRWSCITHVALAKVAGRTVGMATLTPRGEQNTGEPTVVGLYVLPEFRRFGIGIKLLGAAVRFLQEQVPAKPVRLDILYSAVWRMVERLPPELRELLDARDQTLGGVMDATLEA